MSTTTEAKVVLLGEGRVGKTSCILQYCRGYFSDSQEPTLQASFLTKRLRINDQTLSLFLWDTAGQERYDSLGPLYYRDAKAAVLVYDVTDPSTFTKVKKWVGELQTMLDTVPIIILGNKIDLERQRAIDTDVVLKYAESVGAKHFHTSAKLNKGLDEAFLALARMLIKDTKKASTNYGTMRRTTSVRIVDDQGEASTSTSQSSSSQGVCCG